MNQTKSTDREKYNIFLAYIEIKERNKENESDLENSIIKDLNHYEDDESIKEQIEVALEHLLKISDLSERLDKLLILKCFIEKVEKKVKERFQITIKKYDDSKRTQNKNEYELAKIISDSSCMEESEKVLKEEMIQSLKSEIEYCKSEQLKLTIKKGRIIKLMCLYEKLLTLIEEKQKNIPLKTSKKNASVYFIVAVILGTSFFLASCNNTKQIVLKNSKKQIENVEGNEKSEDYLSTLVYLKNLRIDKELSKKRIKESF